MMALSARNLESIFQGQTEAVTDGFSMDSSKAVVKSGRGYPYFDPDYDTLQTRLNPPSVVIDNNSCADVTIIKVDSANKYGILLEVVQVLTDMDLHISKAYICSDGGWFMDVFHVTDVQGRKLTDKGIMEYIQQSLGAQQESAKTEVRTCLGRTVKLQSMAEHTAIELTGKDRPGLLSEISGVLKDLKCNVVAAEVWTHNRRVACVVHVTDEVTCGSIEEPHKLKSIKDKLSDVLSNNKEGKSGKTDFSLGLTHTERPLHQMMFADLDYEGVQRCKETCQVEENHLRVTVHNCKEKGYSVVSVRSRDRPKLLFDTVCTLTDMQYVVSHASITTDSLYAYQEFYLQCMDGCTMSCELEKQRVIQCLEAALNRRISELPGQMFQPGEKKRSMSSLSLILLEILLKWKLWKLYGEKLGKQI